MRTPPIAAGAATTAFTASFAAERRVRASNRRDRPMAAYRGFPRE